MRINNRFPSLFILICLFIVLQSCANYQLHLSQESDSWQNQTPDPSQLITHTMYLIGDAGGAEVGKGLPPAVKLLGEKLKAAPEASSVVYLGDNIYPNGMAPKGKTEERAMDEYRLEAQLSILKDFKGSVFFVAGNHDWYGYGLKGLKRQGKYIEGYLDKKKVLLPEPGCGGPVEVKLNENLTLILVDSQWWLADWEGETEINEGCEVKSRKIFKLQLEEAMKSNRDKNVVIAMHHPLYSFGPHGGRFTAKQTLFPFTEAGKNLWIPFPFIYPLLRSTIGVRQDLANPGYKEMKNFMLAAAIKNGHFIFAAGHEHNLQYIEKAGQHFVVSGSGSKRSAGKMGQGAEFVYGHTGFSQLDFYEDGSVWVQFWVPNEDGSSGRVVFRKRVKGPLGSIRETKQDSFPEFESGKDYVEKPLSDKKITRGPTGRFFLGDLYRESYNTSFKIPILDLSSYQGGVIPIKRGGGYQTNSLRLENEQGRQYTMRSVKKDASRTVPYPLNQSFAKDVIEEYFPADHPLSALPVPALADAVGVYHTNPVLYYVPKQPALDKFNDLFGDALYLVEERPDDDWRDQASFGNSKNIMSTYDMLAEVHNDHKHIVDQVAVVRSRLFDILINDWDRHDDQWRWAQLKDGDKKIYRPIPRDRDQAFSNFDGLMIGLVRPLVSSARQYRPFDSKVNPKKIFRSNYNSRQFDRSFLTELEWADWEREAKYIQQNLSDEIIESAFKDSWPEELFRLDGGYAIQTLVERRDLLLQYARGYYEYLARKVDVVGTEKRDMFEVLRLDNKRTKVTVYDTNKKGEKEAVLFERTFLNEETKEIHLYGLGGNDIFQLSGNVNEGILVRIVGGLGKDTYVDHSNVKSIGKKTVIFDSIDEESTIQGGNEIKNRLSDNPVFNIYERRSNDYELNFGFVLPFFGFNPDDGFLLGGLGQYTTYGFKKDPYASLHSFSGRYSVATSGIGLDYTGEFIGALGKWGIQLEAGGQTPLYSINFYGGGNEKENLEDSLGVNYHRVRQRLVYFAPTLLRKLNKTSSFTIGPTFESIRIENTEGRFIRTIADTLDPELFDGLEFLGARASLDFKNVNDPVFPSRGLGFSAELGWKYQLNNNKGFGYLSIALSFYQQLDVTGRLVLATRIGFEQILNNNFEFYQEATIGGAGPKANFRGFRRERFSGKTAFYNNIDLRWEALTVRNKSLPFSLGLLAGFDNGKVWRDEVESKIWHYSYGGGIWVSPLNLLLIQFSLFKGDGKTNRFTFGGSFFF